ncbi:Sm-like protein LSM4 [Phytophthora citrophthora]|uniref:U6 snRNA-associated Sm-like protein LSm4 n=1 Tax=Phytophthora citrophthora TaxID=4793 RepID=A0AAD9LQK2_9STRA|nr:Sm-like protein LSM4 [Phytophthora citrophthora]
MASATFAAQDGARPPHVELKNGDTYNGHLVNCDTWMNVNLREVICTSKDGDRFWKMPECYIRGNTIKYIRVPNEIAKPIVDVVAEAVAALETEEVAEVEEAVEDVAMALVAGAGVVMEAEEEVEVGAVAVDAVVEITSKLEEKNTQVQ